MSASYEIPHGEISRIDPDMYSYAEQSFNEWQYGDEASLYSIAEDSREDRASEVPSLVGTDTPSEVPSSRAAQVDALLADEEGRRKTEIDGSNSNSFSDIYYRVQHNPRFRALVTCVIIMAIVLAVLVSLYVATTKGSSSGNEVVSTLAPAASPVRPPVSVPLETQAPQSAPTGTPISYSSSQPTLRQLSPTSSPTTPSPTLYPTHSISFTLAGAFISSALRTCADSDIFEDPTTVQGRVYQNLVGELYNMSSVSDDGYIYYPLRFGTDYVKERFGLEVLHALTDGDGWDNDGNWNTATDPCWGWHGITGCKARREGSCGVIEVNLDSNSLAGELPSEICCLPCLETLILSNNMLFGEVPICLEMMGAAVSLENNLYKEVLEARNAP